MQLLNKLNFAQNEKKRAASYCQDINPLFFLEMRWKCWAIGYLKTICNVVLWRSNHEIVQFAIAGVVGRERNCAFGTILSIWLVNEVCGTTIKSLNSHLRVLHILFGITSFDIGVMSPQFYNAYAFKHILHLSSFLTKLRNQNAPISYEESPVHYKKVSFGDWDKS